MSASREKKMRKGTSQTASAAKNENKKSLKSVLGVVIALAAIALIVFFTMVNTNFFESHVKVATVSGHELTGAEVNYWLWDTYQDIQTNMQTDPTLTFDISKPLTEQPCTLEGYEGKTWYDYVLDQALASASITYAIYDEAQESGFTLSKEGTTSIDAQMQSLDSMAQVYQLSGANEYLSAVYGDGCKADSYENYLTVNAIAQEYQAHVMESFTFEDAELDAYYAEHAEEYDLVRFRVFNIHAESEEPEVAVDETTAADTAVTDATTEDTSAVEEENVDEEAVDADDVSTEETVDVEEPVATEGEHSHSEEAVAAAEADANAMMEASTTEEIFLVEATNRIPEDERASYDADSETIQLTTKAEAIAYYGEWFESEHTYGDKTVIPTEHGAQVIFFLGTISGDTKLTDVRHILVRAETEEGSYLPTPEAYDVAYVKAEEILNEYLAGELTADSFAALASSKTEDPGSMETGGLYEAIDPTQMVTPFANWAYANHLPGDTSIVKTNYGYHVMYFVGESETRYGTSVAETGLQADRIEEWMSSIEASATHELKNNRYIIEF